MEAGIREAVGLLIPVLAHQLYRRLQSRERARPALFDNWGLAEEAEPEEQEEVEEEPPTVDSPHCPVPEGSSLQVYVRRLSYNEDHWIVLHIAGLCALPVLLWKLLRSSLRLCFGPLRTPRRNVAFRTPRARV